MTNSVRQLRPNEPPLVELGYFADNEEFAVHWRDTINHQNGHDKNRLALGYYWRLMDDELTTGTMGIAYLMATIIHHKGRIGNSGTVRLNGALPRGGRTYTVGYLAVATFETSPLPTEHVIDVIQTTNMYLAGMRSPYQLPLPATMPQLNGPGAA